MREIVWNVQHLTAHNAKEPRQNAASTLLPTPFLDLDEGEYRVTATREDFSFSREIKVSRNHPRLETFVLNAGIIKASAQLVKGSAALENTQWTLFKKTAEDRAEKMANRNYVTEPKFFLAPGAYILTAKNGDAEASLPLQIHAGDEKDLPVVL